MLVVRADAPDQVDAILHDTGLHAHTLGHAPPTRLQTVRPAAPGERSSAVRLTGPTRGTDLQGFVATGGGVDPE